MMPTTDAVRRSRLGREGLLVVLLASVVSCQKQSAPLPPEHVHYTIGNGWQGHGAWFYPREEFAYRATGLAVVDSDTTARMTADGERYNPQAMTGSHQTLQLPSVVVVRNLDNGREITIRLTDRGPQSPGRLISLTPAAARALGMTRSPAKVSVIEDESSSRQIAEQSPDAPHIDVSAAPVGSVEAETLGPPGQGGRGGMAQFGQLTDSESAQNSKVTNFPVAYRQSYATGGALWIDAGAFSQRRYAARVAAQCNGRVDFSSEAHGLNWRVRLGPFADVQEADTALDQTIRDGVTGARIVVE